ncbi:hypothetical protein UPYG_G00171670 [Umbra pygmaea]|uniref:Uncharacterized protein n=1 Tax=Umbra pygmaea TaxID=75934 RepID=A0ABD0WTE8_UMBPY
MQKGWNLSTLKNGNEQTLKGLKFPNQASSIVLLSKGPTAGVLSVSDEVEDTPASEPTDREMDDDENQKFEIEDSSDAEEATTEGTDEPQRKTAITKKATVSFHVPVPVNIDLATVHTDDAYDFNTDFK